MMPGEPSEATTPHHASPDPDRAAPRPSRPRGGPRSLAARWWVAGAVAVLVAGVGVTAAIGGSGSARTGGGQAGTVHAPDDAAISAVLRRQSEAISTRDRAAFLATIDPAQTTYRARASQIFGNLAELPLADWRLTLDPVQPVAPRPGGDTMRVTLHYRLAGYDTGDVTSTRYLTFAERKGGWVVEGDGSAAGMRDDGEIWDEGPITVVRGASSLVIGDSQAPGTAAELRQISQVLDQSVPAVTSVVGAGWPRKVVAEAPVDDQELTALLGGDSNIRDIAAMTTVTPDPAGPSHGQNRIVIAPDTFGELNALGRRVVLTHETTHVATDAAADTTTPMWLVEGLADYVGYRDTGVSVRAAAKELQTDIAAGHAPTALPGRPQFAGESGGLAQAYEEAWLACRMIAERYGEPTLVRLYRTATRQSQAQALRTVLNLTTAQFTTAWLAYLHQQLG